MKVNPSLTLDLIQKLILIQRPNLIQRTIQRMILILMSLIFSLKKMMKKN